MSTQFAELVLVIGHDAAHRLVQRFGGTNIFPPAPGATGVRWETVRLTIGLDAADALCARYANTRLYVPLNVAARRDWQAREIVRLAAQGLSDNEIADRITVLNRPTASWVARIRRLANKSGQAAEHRTESETLTG